MKATTTKRRSKKQIDRDITSLYGKLSAGRVIAVMDIGKVFDAGHAAVRDGLSLEDAVQAAIDKYTKPA